MVRCAAESAAGFLLGVTCMTHLISAHPGDDRSIPTIVLTPCSVSTSIQRTYMVYKYHLSTMHSLLSFLLVLPLFPLLISANTEKTIFLAPSPVLIPALTPNLDDLGLQRLSPSSSYLRTQVNASFPTTHDDPIDGGGGDGTDTWYFLENLTPGQRYEVRLCWLATVLSSLSIPSKNQTKPNQTNHQTKSKSNQPYSPSQSTTRTQQSPPPRSSPP